MLRVREREATLLDLLDRLLDKGVVVAGDLTLSVAEVDLIFASLRLVVTSVDKIWEVQERGAATGNGGRGPGPVPPRESEKSPVPEEVPGLPAEEGYHSAPAEERGVSADADFDPDKAANGLAKLVLTLVELIRRLLERETLRRMERNTLTSQQTERLGRAFSLMERKMQQMREAFHLQEEDLGLDLGPLGRLM